MGMGVISTENYVQIMLGDGVISGDEVISTYNFQNFLEGGGYHFIGR